MGSCNFKSDPSETSIGLSKAHFQFHYCIGKGGFGKVWKVELKKSKELFAMKEMSKARILSKNSVASVMNERKLLLMLNHGFIVNIHYAFQDMETLYLVTDLKTGGDLRYHISVHQKFSETQTRFFICCILSALTHLHMAGVLHRDVKPENLVMDEKGYLHLTDFGIARVWNPENAKDTSGTPGYMAPEVMCKQKHGVAADYFALGVIAYECMLGNRPYQGRSRKDIREEILAKQVQVSNEQIPQGWSVEAADFVNKLIQRKPVNRLGSNGPADVKNHPWIKEFDWNALSAKQLQAPFVPNLGEEHFSKIYNGNGEMWRDANTEALQQSVASLRRNSIQDQFSGYFYDLNESANQRENDTNRV